MLSRLVVLVSVLGLAACGGGGGSSAGGGGTPPTNPPVVYAAAIHWSGASAPKSLSNSMRRPLDTATPYPVTITAPDCAPTAPVPCSNSALGAISGSIDTAGTMRVVVSPAPASTPNPSWSNSPGSSTVITPNSNGTAEIAATAPGTSGASTVAATIAYPATTATIQVLQFKRCTIAGYSTNYTTDPTRDGSSYYAGIAIVNGVPQGATSPGASDIYFSGQGVYAPFNGPEAIPTIHTPYGAKYFNSATDPKFLDLTIALWSNSTTAIDVQSVRNLGYDEAIFKTATGDYVFWQFFPPNVGTGSPQQGALTSGPCQRHGDGPSAL